MVQAPPQRSRRWFACLCCVCCGMVVWLTARPAWAGGGPENTVVVVNRDSWLSLSVANHYVQLRKIPTENVILLDGIPDFERISVEQFREQILTPVLQQIDQRGFLDHIDYVVYSCDLPWSIDVREDMKGAQLPRVVTPQASINGLTFLYQSVLSKQPRYLQLSANRYVRRPLEKGAQIRLTPDAVKVLHAAMSSAQKAKWQEAEDGFRQLTEQFPQNQAMLINLAACLTKLEKLDEAMQVLKRAAETGGPVRRRIEADETFKPLRTRDDYPPLLAKFDKRQLEAPATVAFRNRDQYDAAGHPVLTQGEQYLLSTMLGVASGRGNSWREIRQCLESAAEADGTFPKGTIYFPVNSNVRSKTRDGLYASAIEELKRQGVRAELVQGTVPREKSDVVGAMVGTASFDWAKSGSRITPGAICEHLTSFGGVMRHGAGQTPLSEWIRYGAAGSSGTVTEPYALQQKFPLPFLHVHYARGASLGEAFYQSVAGPYQLLIVGDPLCQPWARRPVFALTGLKPGESVKPSRTVRCVEATDQPSPAIATVRWFLDGKVLQTPPDERELVLGEASLSPGYHELRVVAVADTDIEAQAHRIVPFTVVSTDRSCQVNLGDPSSDGKFDWNSLFEVVVEAPGAMKIHLHQYDRVLASLDGESGTVKIAASSLGLGHSQLTASAHFEDGTVRSRPLAIEVKQPDLLPAQTADFDGIRLHWSDDDEMTVPTVEADWLKKLGKPDGTAFMVERSLRADDDGLHQLQVKPSMPLQIVCGGLTLSAPAGEWTYCLLPLKKGNHFLALRGKLDKRQAIDVRFGLRGTRPLLAK